MILTSTPKKAVLQENNLASCKICGSKNDSTQIISIFGRSSWDLRGTLSIICGAELQNSEDSSCYVCKKTCFPRLKKIEKMSATLSCLEKDLREEFVKINKATIRIKRAMSTNMESSQPENSKVIKKELFPLAPTTLFQSVPTSTVVKACLTPLLIQALPICVTDYKVLPAIPRTTIRQPNLVETIPKKKTVVTDESQPKLDPCVKVSVIWFSLNFSIRFWQSPQIKLLSCLWHNISLSLSFNILNTYACITSQLMDSHSFDFHRSESRYLPIYQFIIFLPITDFYKQIFIPFTPLFYNINTYRVHLFTDRLPVYISSYISLQSISISLPKIKYILYT